MGNRYSYQDYPDGTNCIYKTACVTKGTSMLAFYIASCEVIFSKSPNFGAALVRYPKYMVPGVLSGVVFGMTACTCTLLRKKDDNWNYIFAGGAMGSVIGIARRSFAVGTPSVIFCAFWAMCYKHYQRYPASKEPYMTSTNGQWDSMSLDYTITPERPKYTVDRPSFV